MASIPTIDIPIRFVIAEPIGAIVLARLTQEHRKELAELRALLVRYREIIVDAGLVPPDDSGAEALERFRNAFRIAGLEDDLQHSELLADWSNAA